MATARTKDYEAIARASIRDPNFVRPPRILCYSRNKKGKTRFCLTAPKCIIADPEHGTDPYLTIAKKMGAKIWPISKWEQLDDLYGYLRTGNHPYEWVCLDGTTKMHNFALRYIMNQAMERDLEKKPEQIGKQEYGKSGRLMDQMFLNFDSLQNMGVLYTAQERMIEITETGEEDEDAEAVGASFVADLPRGARGSLNSIVDVIGRLYTIKTDVKLRNPNTGIVRDEKRIQRRLWLEPHPSYDTGYRSEYVLPSYLKNPTVPGLVRLIKEGAKPNG